MRKLFAVTMLLVLSAAAFAAPSEVTVRSLKVLVPIYRGAPDDAKRLDDAALEGTKNGIELGRLFYYRNTQGRLNLDVTMMVIEQSAPKNEGPTYQFIEEDLRARGIKDNQYDGIFATGVGFTGNWGGFRVLGKTGAAFGGTDARGGLRWYPENRPDVWYGTGWTFVHEFQHALDGPICNASGRPDMLHGHPYADCTEPHFTWGHYAGQHWDWEAHTLAVFQDYMEVRGNTDSVIVAVDTDGDGLPDNDPRLPMDEKRFGSDPTKVDTDGDGLDDLAEFCADIYRGSDPRNPDTDGDGIPDGKDRNPTVALVETVSYTDLDPEIDGRLDRCYTPLTMGVYVHNSPSLAAARIHACWNEDALFLLVKSAAKCSLEMMIDTSAENGFWEGGDTYPIRVTPDGKVIFSDLGLKGEVTGARAVWGRDGLEVMIPALIGQGVSHEINWGGKRRVEDTIDGLVLMSGRAISFNLAVASGEERALITPNWTMFTTVPVKSPSDPSRPSLRFTQKVTRDLQPAVVVSGTGPSHRVQIVDQKGTVLGERMGDGPVIITSKLKAGSDAASGTNVLRARCGDRVSQPVALVIDREALPPRFARAGDGRFTVAGEPGASVEVYAGLGGSPSWPMGSVVLDDAGRGEYRSPVGARGYLGAYGLGTAFDRPLFTRVDEEIKFDYEGGTCDPRLPGEGFCIRWTGYLQVPADGDYTFYLSTDDGSRLWIDGVQVIDNWGHHAVEEKSATVKLAKGEHDLRVDYYEEYGWAAAHLEWSGPGISRTHALPVTPLPGASGAPSLFARQTDAVGNVSLFKKL